MSEKLLKSNQEQERLRRELVKAIIERDELQKKHDRLNELLDDYIQDKKQVGRFLGLSEENALIHDMQKNVIFAIKNAIRSDKPSYEQLNEIRKILKP